MSGAKPATHRARLLAQEGRFEEAEREYAYAVALEPTDFAAQRALAALRYMRGDPQFARDLATAAARHRTNALLQQQFADVLRQTGDLVGSEILLRDLIARFGPSAAFRASLATVLHEAGRLHEACIEARAAANGRPGDDAVAAGLVAVLLSLGRADEAMPIIRAARARAAFDQAWIAHEATAARLLDDPAYEWLYDYERFVRAYDLEAPRGWRSMHELNAALADVLSVRHTLVRQPFDQSMRSGTQTMRNLVDDPEPAIRAVLGAFEERIAEYRAELVCSDAHPLAGRNRGTARIVGCWSVRLQRNGYHVNHIHPEGWLSSAYYIDVPTEAQDRDKQRGWIRFGEPARPVPGAAPQMTVEPLPGRLVLFPSYMWHGTTPIRSTQQRLTMAFDVIPDACG